MKREGGDVANPATIVLFAYRRLAHLERTMKALARNKLANASELVVYSDGWKSASDRADVERVRAFLAEVKGFRSVSVVARERNYGLGNNIIAGVTETTMRCDKVIVLEDDLVTSPHFLQYMNDGLGIYERDDRVISIHGYSYPVHGKLPETFFLRGADCLGWATWKRGWDLFEDDGQRLLNELERRNLTRSFDFDGSYPYTQMLRDQIAGSNSSWAVRWYASAFLRDKLTLYPGQTLVSHIGYDTGTNFGRSRRKPEQLASKQICVVPMEPKEDMNARATTSSYLQKLKGGLMKSGLRRVKTLTRKIGRLQKE